MLEFCLSPKAEQDLESIWVYSFEHWGLVKADQYVDSLFSAFGELANSSKLAISCDHIRIGYRFCREGKHIIYFKMTEYGIVIIRILHERMLPSLHL